MNLLYKGCRHVVREYQSVKQENSQVQSIQTTIKVLKQKSIFE